MQYNSFCNCNENMFLNARVPWFGLCNNTYTNVAIYALINSLPYSKLTFTVFIGTKLLKGIIHSKL